MLINADEASDPSPPPEDRASPDTTAGASKSRLHNFAFPSLRWGNQQQLRCVKLGIDVAPSDELGSTAIQPSASSPKKPTAVAQPWNLRKRRAACYTPKDLGQRGNRNPSSALPSPLPREKDRLKSLRLKSEALRPKFSRQLSPQEIEEDFLKMKGTKPPRRPRKRPKFLQNQIEALYPGSCLVEITADLYKIHD